jgi:hypothetical protein
MEISSAINKTAAYLHIPVQGYADYTLLVYDRIDLIADQWDGCVDSTNIFLSATYLKAVEIAGPHDLKHFYCLVIHENKPFLALYCQFKHFNAAESLQLLRQTGDLPYLEKIKRKALHLVAAKVDFHALVCGNIMVTGEHAYRFCRDSKIFDEVSFIPDLLQTLQSGLETLGLEVPVIFVKDFYDKRLKDQNRCFIRAEYKELVFQPNMIFHIPKTWRNTKDYLANMKSKYRVRTKRARKFVEGLERREMFLKDIEEYRERIHALYLEIAHGAEFNLFLLPPDYFSGMKSALGNCFRIFGYFDGDDLIGFYSLVINGKEMEAHFLGYREEDNRAFQLYHNMLIDMVEEAIRAAVDRIVFARTALEIKSSVGAVPEDMHCYIRHNYRLYNAAAPLIFKALNPDYDWEQRHPFSDPK